MMIDSGASVNTVSEEFFYSIINDPGSKDNIYEINLQPSKKLMAYATDKPLTVIASFVANLIILERPAGSEKFFVIKGATSSLLGKAAALRYNVLKIGLNVPVTETQFERNDKIAIYLLNTHATSSAFPKFNRPPVKLNIDKAINCRKSSYSNIEYIWIEKAHERLEEMRKTDIIEEVTDDMDKSFCSSLLAVPKGVDDFRLVVDLRGPNKAIIREPHLMPTLDSILTKLEGSKLFSAIDLSNAFFHIELHPESRYVTNFFSGKKMFRYKRLPFGLCNAPDIFQKTIEEVLEGCKGVIIYLDDLLIFGKTKEEHDINLGKVLERLREHNVKLNKEKCQFGQPKVKFVGFLFTKDGYRITKEKTDAIRSFRKPESVSEVKSFLGLMNFVHKEPSGNC